MQDLELDALKLRVSTELMENHAAGAALTARAGMRAVRDANGHAILVWIEDGMLCAVMRSASSRTGWRRCELTAKREVHAFDVVQLADERLVLAIATVDDKGKRALHVTAPLSCDPGAAQWDDMGNRWIARDPVPGDGTVVSLRIGPGSADAMPLAVAAVRTGDTVEQYLVNLAAHDTRWSWSRFELPNNADAKKPVVLAAGVVQGDRGVFALYETASEQVLEFTTEPDPLTGRSERYAYELPARVSCLAVAASAQPGASDVYVAGAGIHVFPGDATDDAVQLSWHGPAVHELAVTQDTERTSLFAIAGDQQLVHTEGPRGTPRTWLPVAPILGGVANAAIVRGAGANELFAAIDGEPVFVYQDPATQVWKPSKIQLPSAANIARFTTYTTRIEVRDADRRPCIAAPFELRAGSRTSLFVNGRLHLAGSHHAVLVETDPTGALTIALPIDDVSAPTLTLRRPGAPAEVELRPSQGIEAYLAGVTDFGAEKLRDGTPLIEPGSADADTLLSIRDATHDILSATKAGSSHLLRGPADGATRRLSIANGRARMTVHGDGMLHAAGAAWDPDWAKAILVEAGKALAWMWDRISDAIELAWRVVGPAIEVLVQIGIETWTFVLHNIETGLRTIAWILEKGLGIDLDRVWKWLGHIFHWDEIEQLRDMMVGRATSALGELQVALPALAKRADAMLSDVRKYLPKPNESLVPATFHELEQPGNTQDASAMRDAAGSPATQWAMSHVLHSGSLLDLCHLGPDAASIAPLMKRLAELWDGLGAAKDAFLHDVADLFTGESIDLRETLRRISGDAAFALLEALRGLTSFLFEALSTQLDGIAKVLTTPVAFPIFRGLLGRDCSILEVVATVVAAQASITHRIATGRGLAAEANGPARLMLAQEAPSASSYWLFAGAALAFDVLNIASAMAAMAEASEGLVVVFDAVRFGANIMRLVFGRPFPDGTRQFEPQLTSWATYVVGCCLDFLGWWVALGSYRLMRTKQLPGEPPAPPDPEMKKYFDGATSLRGIVLMLTAGVVGIAELVTTVIDFEVLEGYAKEDAQLKVFQNFSYFVADLTSGLISFAGAALNKAAKPEATEPTVILAAVSAIAATSAVTFNTIRIYRNEERGVPHKNF